MSEAALKIEPMNTDSHAQLLAHQFGFEPTQLSLNPIGNGHINTTMLLKHAHGAVVVQRLNTDVFPNPDKLVANARKIEQHLLKKHRKQQYQLDIIKHVATTDQRYLLDINGEKWRALEFIGGSYSEEVVRSPSQAKVAANAFGQFAAALEDFDAEQLYPVIKDFHNLAMRLDMLEQAVQADSQGRVAKVDEQLAFCQQQTHLVHQLAELVTCVPVRPCHNDTKINNMLFSNKTDQAKAENRTAPDKAQSLMSRNAAKLGEQHGQIDPFSGRDFRKTLQLRQAITADEQRQQRAVFDIQPKQLGERIGDFRDIWHGRLGQPPVLESLLQGIPVLCVLFSMAQIKPGQIVKCPVSQRLGQGGIVGKPAAQVEQHGFHHLIFVHGFSQIPNRTGSARACAFSIRIVFTCLGFARSAWFQSRPQHMGCAYRGDWRGPQRRPGRVSLSSNAVLLVRHIHGAKCVVHTGKYISIQPTISDLSRN